VSDSPQQFANSGAEIVAADRGAGSAVVAPAGQLMIGGTFAIYMAAGGGLVMVTDVEGRGVERRAIPKAMVDMFSGKGPLGKMAAKMFGGTPPVGD
jgi:hypothetical protein